MSQPASNDRMSFIVRTVCSWLKGFILLYGIHIILYGHLTPGGGFAGGVVAAAAFVMIVLAQGQQQGLINFPRNLASTFDSVGVLLFLSIALLGLVLAGTFFVNFLTTEPSSRFTLMSGGIIPLCNIGIGLKVCCSLYLVFVLLNAVHRSINERTKGEDS